MFKSSNPILSERILEGVRSIGDRNGSMTADGTINKSILLFLLLIGVSALAWSHPNPIYTGVGIFGGLILAIITVFKKEWSPITAPLYTIFEGLFLGAISVYFEMLYTGIVLKAISLTFAVFFSMFFLYKSKVIAVNDKFRIAIFAATSAIAIVYIVNMVLRFFGTSIPFVHEGGVIGIGFSLIVVGIAALNLILDFDFIDNASQQNLPKYMEWYGAFGLMVTLIWLYLEIIRLLSKILSRR